MSNFEKLIVTVLIGFTGVPSFADSGNNPRTSAGWDCTWANRAYEPGIATLTRDAIPLRDLDCRNADSYREIHLCIGNAYCTRLQGGRITERRTKLLACRATATGQCPAENPCMADPQVNLGRGQVSTSGIPEPQGVRQTTTSSNTSAAVETDEHL